MATPKSIGAIELSSIALGYRVQDEMLDAADVEVLIARTICSGKYFIVLGGSVSDVQAAIRAGLRGTDESIIDHLVIPNVHESVFPALGQSVTIGEAEVGALGVVETFSGVSVIAAADAAAKAARVTLFRIHVAMALGGKGFCLMTGTVADCRAGVSAAAAEARQRGLLVAETVIARPHRELFSEYI
ncbi:MAG TPA: BMC domain-containing protein [Phycisphaerae bacterium]|nr:BMC domain-containing protein [Phycisphaerae bacterium]